jgi:hypothetical protein
MLKFMYIVTVMQLIIVWCYFVWYWRLIVSFLGVRKMEACCFLVVVGRWQHSIAHHNQLDYSNYGLCMWILMW